MGQRKSTRNRKRNGDTGRDGALPVIARYPAGQRLDYLLLVAVVAVSDRELHPDELELLERWMREFRLSPRSREKVMAALRMEPVDVEALEKRLSGSDLRYSLMLDMMGMAMADGVLMDDERLLLRDVADYLEIDPIDFNILIEFVHSAYQAAFLNNPEPLYEHNIESALSLLRERQVPLFRHTLLCVADPEYDRHLKERYRRLQQGA